MIKILILLSTVLAALAQGACAAVAYPPFGSLPKGEHQRAVEESPNYRNGEFRNAVATPILADGSSFIGALIRGRFEKRERPAPTVRFPPSRRTCGRCHRSRTRSCGSATLPTTCRWAGAGF
jgi:hypothetical protein